MEWTLWGWLGSVLLLAVTLAIFWYRVVPVNMAHVVVALGKTCVYSGHKEHGGDGRAAYFEIPSFIPFFGVQVHKISLQMIEVDVPNFLAFDRDRVRFECDIVAYLAVDDAIRATQRFPQGPEELKSQVVKIVQATTRDTTTKLTIREVINERDLIAQKIHQVLSPEVQKWGMSLQALELVNISDPADKSTTVIQDISSIVEVQINSEARQKNAEQRKQARLKEAETEQLAKVREIERDEEVGKREQLKELEVAKQRQLAQEEAMRVTRVQQVRQAEIERDAAVERAEGEKQSIIRVKGGEAEGVRAVGYAEADAKSRLADALKKINDAALQVRQIEKDEKIGVTAAEALKNADIRFINAGPTTSLMDLFTPSGGANLGGMINALEATSPALYQELKSWLAGRLSRVPAQGTQGKSGDGK